MIPELTDKNVDQLATTFLNTNVLLRHPITLTTFIGYAFPTDEHHPEPWGKRAGQLRNAIKKWIDEREELVGKVTSKRGKLTFAWTDPLKVAALRARRGVILPDARDKSGTKRFVQAAVAKLEV